VSQAQPDQPAELEVEDLQLLSRLLVGLLLAGGDELLQIVRGLQREIEANPGLLTPVVADDETTLDLLRYLTIGLLARGQKRVARGVQRGIQLSLSATGWTLRTLDRWMPRDGWYRPPFGKMTPLTWAAVRRRRSPIGWWTIKSGDVMEEPPRTSSAADAAAKAGGGVVLLHDFDRGNERADFVLASTEHLLDAAAEYGWSVRTLGELTARANGNGHAR